MAYPNYPKKLFALLAAHIDPQTHKVLEEVINIDTSLDGLQTSSFPNPFGKQIAIYELKEFMQFEDAYDKHEEQPG